MILKQLVEEKSLITGEMVQLDPAPPTRRLRHDDIIHLKLPITLGTAEGLTEPGPHR